MSQLIVRNLPRELVSRLKRRAAEHNRSEAEHRQILMQALLAEDSSSLKALLGAMPNVGDDSDFSRRRGRLTRMS